jgi:hypothetical protein
MDTWYLNAEAEERFLCLFSFVVVFSFKKIFLINIFKMFLIILMN